MVNETHEANEAIEVNKARANETKVTNEASVADCPKPFTGIEEHCLEKSTRVGADYQFVMIN